MSAVLFLSDQQTAARISQKVHHAEPQLYSRNKVERIEADRRIREIERDLRQCQWGSVEGQEL